MRAYRSAALTVTLAAAVWMTIAAVPAAGQFPLEPTKNYGQAVWPVYEGWYDNADGSFTLLVGYFNPNKEQPIDIAIGESNFFSPGPQDRGQPTHFAAVRGWGVFTVRVPADFGDKQISWTITANDQPATIPMHLDPNWYLEPFEDAANKNRPPTLRFAPGGKAFEGPPTGEIATTLNTTVGAATDLTLWATDVKAVSLAISPPSQIAGDDRNQQRRRRRPGLMIRWCKMHGPGTVTFDPAVEEFETSTQNSTAKASFSMPGEYVLRVEALDETGSGGGGSQCCWTSAYVQVNVGGTPDTGD